MKYQDKQIEIQKSLFNSSKFGGLFMGDDRNFVLKDPRDNFIHNVNYGDVINYFIINGINWWKGKAPTGHILSSQIACLNHLFPIRNSFDAVLALVKTIDADFDGVEIIKNDKEGSQGYISFEVVSDTDHLNEKRGKNKKLTRGSQCTSIDAVIIAKKMEKRTLITIEWKYVEHYYNVDKSKNPKGKKSGDSRLNNYCGSNNVQNPHLIQNSCQLAKKEDYRGSVYFFEPFYQLMRQTLWAEQMIKNEATETIKADDFINLHIIPKENNELRNKLYKCSGGKDLLTTWQSQLVTPSKYVLMSPDEFFAKMIPEYSDLVHSLQIRYWQ